MNELSFMFLVVCLFVCLNCTFGMPCLLPLYYLLTTTTVVMFYVFETLRFIFHGSEKNAQLMLVNDTYQLYSTVVCVDTSTYSSLTLVTTTKSINDSIKNIINHK